MILPNNEELLHYGVLGMKWGVRKASRQAEVNKRLLKKAEKYDLKSAKAAKKSEKIHNKQDLQGATKLGIKAEKQAAKAAQMQRKATSAKSDNEKVRYERKAAKRNYKAARLRMRANQITKTKGYGLKSLEQLKKSDKYAKKAAKARLKIANNEFYINKMKNKVSSLSKEELQNGYAFCNNLFKE